MAEPWQSGVQSALKDLLRSGDLPGLAIAVARGDRAPSHLVVGSDAAGQPITTDTLFPVASITKLATALAVLRLANAGTLGLDDPLSRHLPAAAAARAGITLRNLLSHTSGLPVDPPPEAAPYTPALTWQLLAEACLATPVARPPESLVSYSNVGPGLLAIVVERQTKRSFSAALSELVLEPLGIEGYLGVEPPRAPARIDGELGEHAGSDLEPYNSAFWRSLALPWGGMLTTAAGALALVRAFAGVPDGFLALALLTEATRDQSGGLAGDMMGFLQWPRGAWGLGVDLRDDKSPHWAPSEASPGSFGHPGASGCLAWADPAAGVAWAMLGARTFESWWSHWPAIGAAILAAAR